MRLRKPTSLAASTALILAVCVLASCSSGAASNSSPSAAGSGAGSSASQSASPVHFHSPEYGYSVTIPAGWNTNRAFSKWDGRLDLTVDSLYVDRFFGGGSPISFAAAVGWRQGLAAFARHLIANTVKYHLATCPRRPNRQKGIEIGGKPGVLLEYNCGILINMAATVQNGVGYVFLFKDDGVMAASNPTDHAVFAQMLGSVEFPH